MEFTLSSSNAPMGRSTSVIPTTWASDSRSTMKALRGIEHGTQAERLEQGKEVGVHGWRLERSRYLGQGKTQASALAVRRFDSTCCASYAQRERYLDMLTRDQDHCR